MSPLSPPLQQFLEAMVAAFDQPALEELARFGLGVRLDILIDPVGSTPQLVGRLLDRVERGGWTEELIRGAYKAEPKAPLLLAFCQTHAAYVFTPRPATTDLARAVWGSLGQATAGLQAGRATLPAGTEARLRGLSPGFARLRDYKALHDCLHNLQFKHVRLIAQGLRALAKDPADPAGDDLPIYFAEAEDTLQAVGPAADALGGLERAWLNASLQAVRRLREGVQGRDLKAADAGLRLLGSQLRTQPTRINQALIGVLKSELPFDELLAALRALTTQLGAGGGPGAALVAATAALGSLVPRLNRNLSDHNDWQQIDNSLVQIDDELKREEASADLCSDLWQGADIVLGPMLASAGREPWALELRGLSEAFVRSMPAGVTGGVRLAFGPFRARAGSRFYFVDCALRDLTGDLVSIGTQLDLLIKVIGDGA